VSEIKNLIREYLLEENYYLSTIRDDPKLEFGYKFIYPGGTRAGKNIGRQFTVIRPKNQNFIDISCGTQIAPAHFKVLNSSPDKKLKFFNELKKLLFLKGYLFNIDINNNRYVVVQRIHAKEKSKIAKNLFYKKISKMFGVVMYTIILLQEYCSGAIKSEDFRVHEGFGSKIDSLVVDDLQLPSTDDFRIVQISDLNELIRKLKELAKGNKEIDEFIKKMRNEYDF